MLPPSRGPAGPGGFPRPAATGNGKPVDPGAPRHWHFGRERVTVRLWDARRHRFEAALTGHTGSARGISFSPDARTLASSGNDRTVRLWEVAGRRPVAALSGHTSAVWGVSFSPDGRTVASSTDGTVRLWDVDVGVRLAEVCRLSGGTACPRR